MAAASPLVASSAGGADPHAIRASSDPATLAQVAALPDEALAAYAEVLEVVNRGRRSTASAQLAATSTSGGTYPAQLLR
ncbi:MAG: hypothetical protein M3R63_18430 [Actinomycetota bacterium]|nr:hypothetical protein [Actinomycetota bacterium]